MHCFVDGSDNDVHCTALMMLKVKIVVAVTVLELCALRRLACTTEKIWRTLPPFLHCLPIALQLEQHYSRLVTRMTQSA